MFFHTCFISDRLWSKMFWKKKQKVLIAKLVLSGHPALFWISEKTMPLNIPYWGFLFLAEAEVWKLPWMLFSFCFIHVDFLFCWVCNKEVQVFFYLYNPYTLLVLIIQAWADRIISGAIPAFHIELKELRITFVVFCVDNVLLSSSFLGCMHFWCIPFPLKTLFLTHEFWFLMRIIGNSFRD